MMASVAWRRCSGAVCASEGAVAAAVVSASAGARAGSKSAARMASFVASSPSVARVPGAAASVSSSSRILSGVGCRGLATQASSCSPSMASSSLLSKLRGSGSTPSSAAITGASEQRRFLHYPVPASKLKKMNRRERVISKKWLDVNDPKLVEKNLRFAERRAREHGDLERIEEFDANCAAFPNPAPLVTATLLERANLVMRDLEDWETEFLEWQEQREDAKNKEYLNEFVERTLAATKIKEASEESVVGGSSGETTTAMYYANEGFQELDEDQVDTADFRAAPRTSEADKINDTRSLDRALSQRLVLLLRRKDTGQWEFPQGIREDGETMVGAARRHMFRIYGPSLEAWYPGNAPMSYWLLKYDEETQKATQCYGAKVFFYRAQIFKGRIELSEDYDDFRWLTRDELGEYLVPQDPTFARHIHRVVGAGPGEEYARRQAAIARGPKAAAPVKASEAASESIPATAS